MQKKIPKIYYYINDINLTDLSKLGKNINIIFRNYEKKVNYKDLIILKNYCHASKRKLFISNNIKLALKLKLNGIYIPSFNNKINYISSFTIPLKFEIIGSAHTFQEIRIKKKQGCKEIFISPLFKVQNKRKPLNIYNFNKLTKDNDFKYIALGGINENNLKKLKLTASSGFAGISWIKKTA